MGAEANKNEQMVDKLKALQQKQHKPEIQESIKQKQKYVNNNRSVKK